MSILCPLFQESFIAPPQVWPWGFSVLALPRQPCDPWWTGRAPGEQGRSESLERQPLQRAGQKHSPVRDRPPSCTAPCRRPCASHSLCMTFRGLGVLPFLFHKWCKEEGDLTRVTRTWAWVQGHAHSLAPPLSCQSRRPSAEHRWGDGRRGHQGVTREMRIGHGLFTTWGRPRAAAL